MNTRDIFRTLLSILCVANVCLLPACKDEDVAKRSKADRVPLHPVAERLADTRLSDTSWEEGDQIGVYAYDSEGVLADATNDNARFVINPENNSCSVANEDSIVWLQKGETYGIVAYYPFSPTFSSVDNPSVPTVFVQNLSTISVDDKPGAEQQLTDPIPHYIILNWADQSDLASLDLLWCRQEGVSADDPDVTLSLAHQFCRVQLNITIDTELSSLTADSLAGMKVLLAGKNFPAFFNLQSGEMSFGPESEDSIAFNIQRQEGATTAVASAIIVPDTENSNTEGRTITVQLPADNDRKYVIGIPDEIVFQSGKLYTWNVTFNTGADLSTNSFYVSATGLDSNDGKRDSPLASFEGAVAKMNAPQADYTIYVDGTLTQYQNLYGALSPSVAQSVTIMGANGIDPETNAPKDSIKLSGSGASVLLVETDVPLTLSNIVLTGGNSNNNGGGILINHYQAKVTLADGAIITGNTAAENGGGIYMVDGASLYMTGGEISYNTAEDGSGGGIYAENCQIRISGNSVISHNVAHEWGYGGGICLEGYSNSSLTLSNNVEISNNETDGSGGGIAVTRSGSVEMYDNVTIHANKAGTGNDPMGVSQGGGVYLGGDSDFGGASFYMWGGKISGNKVLYDDLDGAGPNTEWKDGVYVSDEGQSATFAMGGGAVVASDNDVYLQNSPLYILAPLTGTAPVAYITPGADPALAMGSYFDEKSQQWVSVTTTTVADEYQKFAIWGDKGFLTNEGKYVRNADIQGAVQQILGATVSTTVTLSGYMTNDEIEIEVDGETCTNTPFGHISTALKSLYANYGTEVMITLDMSGVIGMTSVGNFAFENCSALAGIMIPSGVTSFGEAAFIDCTGLTSIEIPSSVTSIGVSAFNGCYGLTSIEIPSSVKSIGRGAFQGCSGLTSIEIPSSVTSISDDAFGGCTGLTSIEIPNSVTSIGSYAFSGCYSLTSITIPSSVTSISFSVFDQCYDFTTVYYEGSEADRDNMTIEDETIIGDGVTWYYNYDGHPFVDLGLPNGLLWATCNVGASKPEGYGNYYAWGETKAYGEEDASNAMNYSYNSSSSYVKTYYDWSTYKYCNGSSSTMTKYCPDGDYGTYDNIWTLELADDAANANWGGDWRMPTSDECQELVNNCSSEWVTDYNGTGVDGRLFTSNNNGNTLFLPAAGYRYDASLTDAGTSGYYWSSSVYESSPYGARFLLFSAGTMNTSYLSRCYGRSVRAVRVP